MALLHSKNHPSQVEPLYKSNQYTAVTCYFSNIPKLFPPQATALAITECSPNYLYGYLASLLCSLLRNHLLEDTFWQCHSQHYFFALIYFLFTTLITLGDNKFIYSTLCTPILLSSMRVGPLHFFFTAIFPVPNIVPGSQYVFVEQLNGLRLTAK